eukprot:gene6758-7855_t
MSPTSPSKQQSVAVVPEATAVTSFEYPRNSLLDTLQPLSLETLEYIELALPTNIYSHAFIAHAPQLLVASRSNLISIHPQENDKTGAINWLTSEIVSPIHMSPRPPAPMSSTPPTKGSPQRMATPQQQQAPAAQQQQQQQMIQSHLQRLPLSHKSRIPPLPIKSPSASQLPPPSSHPQPPQSPSKSPNEDHIVAIDSITSDHRTIVALAVVSTNPVHHKGYLSLYTYKGDNPLISSALPMSSTNQVIHTDFVPFHLTHAPIDAHKTALLLSGSDDKIHIYTTNEHNEYAESDISLYFPELVQLSSPALKIEIKYYQHYRITAVGCQSGYLQLSIVNLLDKSHTTESSYFDGPVQSLCLYMDSGSLSDHPIDMDPNLSKMKSISSSFLKDLLLQAKGATSPRDASHTEREDKEEPGIHLLAASIIGYAVVYRYNE